MNGQSQLIAMSEGINLRFVSSTAHEGIVIRNAPIVLQPEDFTVVAVRILRQRSECGAGGHENRAVFRKDNTRAAEDGCPFSREKILDIDKTISFQAAAGQRRLLLAVFAGLAVREVD